MCFDEPGFAGLKLFFRVHVVRVLFDFMRLSFFAVVYAFLKIVLDYVHFRDDSLESYKFVGQFAAQSSGADEVGPEVAFEADFIVF